MPSRTKKSTEMDVVEVRLDDDADDERSAMITATTSVRVDIKGMTCQKCERLIREALLEKVDGVVRVDVFREESYANVELKTQLWSTKRNKLKTDIIEVIEELVNGKFKAKFHDDPKPATKKLGTVYFCHLIAFLSISLLLIPNNDSFVAIPGGLIKDYQAKMS